MSAGKNVKILLAAMVIQLVVCSYAMADGLVDWWTFDEGKGVKSIKNAYNVAPQHVYSDDELVPSVIKFETDGSPVLVIYQADRTKPLYPDCARPGREGARGILNAFELIQLGPSE